MIGRGPPSLLCSRGVGLLTRELVVLETLLLSLEALKCLRDQRWGGPPLQVPAQDELPGYLLCRHLFKPRVLLHRFAESCKDLIETWLAILGHTLRHVAAGYLAPLERFTTSAILTGWCCLRSARRGNVARVVVQIQNEVSTALAFDKPLPFPNVPPTASGALRSRSKKRQLMEGTINVSWSFLSLADGYRFPSSS
jgi:hypothetical protein